jgi:hypothetical protein
MYQLACEELGVMGVVRLPFVAVECVNKISLLGLCLINEAK